MTLADRLARFERLAAEAKAGTPLPCPFCGHVGLDFNEGSTFRWLVASCSGCGASVGETRMQTLGEGTKEQWREAACEDAIKQWNTRAALPDLLKLAQDYDKRCKELELGRDAARYRWLRRQNWNEAELCVVAQPAQAVKLGHDCPSLDRLDVAIDAAIAKGDAE